MAVLQKIRNKGILLVSIIALALLLFVMGDLLRGCESFAHASKDTVGEINGENVTTGEFQDLLTNYQLLAEATGGRYDAKDLAWQSLVRKHTYGKEAEELGLRVSDDELRQALSTDAVGLMHWGVWMNGNAYDDSQREAVIRAYNEMKKTGADNSDLEKIYAYQMFAQEETRNILLEQKYKMLLAGLVLSNPTEAKQSFAARTELNDLLLVKVPYTSVKDEEVKVEDADLQKKYEEVKESFALPGELRDGKVIDYVLVASPEDVAELDSAMAKARTALAAAATDQDAADVVRNNNSSYAYNDIYVRATALPTILKDAIDGDSTKLGVGQTSQPSYDMRSNMKYVVKLLGKETTPDSVLMRQLIITGKDEAEVTKRRDSVMQVLAGGASFREVAKKYAQQGDSSWMISAYAEGGSLTGTDAENINNLFRMGRGERKAMMASNGNCLIVEVLDTRHPVEKYKVAAVVREQEFSNKTYQDAYNALSSFLAANNDAKSLADNAGKSGYVVKDIKNLSTSAAGIPVDGRIVPESREAQRWLFDTAKKGEVSQLYVCGENQNHLMVVALTDVCNADYLPFDKAKELLRNDVLKDKKAEKIEGLCKNVKSISEAEKVAGATVDTLKQVSFADAARVGMWSEPMVSVLASKTAKGAFAGPVKGNGGVYMLQVLDKSKTDEQLDEKSEMSADARKNLEMVLPYIDQVIQKGAKVKDLRYKYF